MLHLRTKDYSWCAIDRQVRKGYGLERTMFGVP